VPALLWVAACLTFVLTRELPGLAPPHPAGRVEALIGLAQRWLGGNLVWLIAPMVALGTLVSPPLVRITALGWITVAVTHPGPSSFMGACAACVVTAAIGVEWLAKRAPGLRDSRSDRFVTAGALLALPLLVGFWTAWVQAYRARPTALRAARLTAAKWLQAHDGADETVWGALELGALVERPAIAWDPAQRDGVTIARALANLSLDPPETVVTSRSFAWQAVTRSGWFEARYKPVRQFASARDAVNPLTVWRLRAGGYDSGDYAHTDLPLGNGVRVVGYRRWPAAVAPGDAVYLTLFLRAEDDVAEASQAIVRVYAPQNGENYAQTAHPVPDAIPVDWWEPGDVIAERFTLTTTTATPVGAYDLDLSIPDAGVDGLRLAYVAVPWDGEIPSQAKPIDARFEGTISLAAVRLPETLAPDSEVGVTLYWRSDAPQAEDLTVFVHLFGPDGSSVAGYDGPPMGGRYPTGAWQAGDLVPDTHHMQLSEELPTGSYRLVVGLYRSATMERLSVETADGDTWPDRSVTVGSIFR